MAVSPLARVIDVFEPIALVRAERVARGYDEERGAAVRRFATAARARFVAARELEGSQSQVGAFSLLREAAALAISAVSAVHDGDVRSPLRSRAAQDRLRSLTGAGAVPVLPPALAQIAEELASDDPLSTDGLSSGELARAQALVLWLLALVEPRSVGELRKLRALRLGLAGAALVAAAVLGVAFGISSKNLARAGRASASSVRPGFDPSTAIDGKRRDRGFESIVEADPWLAVDLGDHYQIESVVVIERNGARPNRLPRSVLVSDDGTTWRTIATSSTAQNPWRVTADRPWARYVKVALDGRGALSVDELEVYGQ